MQCALNKNVLEIVFDDLSTNNAFDLKKAKTLDKFLSSNNISLIVLRSEGRVFCSGGNLKDYAGLKTKSAGIKVNQQIRTVLNKLAKHPALKIAYVSGDCFGGGIELLSCFDLIYAQPQTFFGMWQRKMSLSFGWGGFERLSKKMSAARAEEWLLIGDVRTAFWACSEGLVNAVVNSRKMNEHLSQMKLRCEKDEDGTFKAIVRDLKKDEVKVFEKLWGSPTHVEKLRKFTSS